MPVVARVLALALWNESGGRSILGIPIYDLMAELSPSANTPDFN
jgi:hypothetical protein